MGAGGGWYQRQQNRQRVKWSAQCHHERKLAPSSSGDRDRVSHKDRTKNQFSLSCCKVNSGGVERGNASVGERYWEAVIE